MVFQQAFGDDAGNLSPYQGWPDDERDKLWEDMYTSEFDVLIIILSKGYLFQMSNRNVRTSEGVSIRIDKAEHQLMPNKTERIPIPGQESEYRIGIDVFHQLHCLVGKSPLLALHISFYSPKP